MGAVESRPSGGGSPADGARDDEPYDAWRGSSTSANRRVSVRARFRASGTRFEDEATSSDTEREYCSKRIPKTIIRKHISW